jgi:hypothetical protein
MKDFSQASSKVIYFQLFVANRPANANLMADWEDLRAVAPFEKC